MVRLGGKTLARGQLLRCDWVCLSALSDGKSWAGVDHAKKLDKIEVLGKYH